MSRASKATIKLQYNSPVVLSFALVSLVVLWFDAFTAGRSTYALFSVYRSSFADFGTYPRFFLHVLGHADYAHYLGNMMFILVLGPPLEERYGSRPLFWAIALTAMVSGMKNGCIPITLVLVLLLYLGGEIIDGITLKDNISQLSHIVGGICGALLGISMRK